MKNMNHTLCNKAKLYFVYRIKKGLLLGFTLFSSFCAAGTEHISVNTYHLHGLLLHALTKQYSIIGARAEIETNHAQELEALSRFLPQLSLDVQPELYRPIGKSGNTIIAGTLVPSDQGFYDNSATANFKLGLFSGGKDFAMLHAANSAFSAASQKQISTIARIFSQILQEYIVCSISSIDIDEYHKMINYNAVLLKLIKLRYKKGMDSRLKLIKYKQQNLSSKIKLQESKMKLNEEDRRLASSVGLTNINADNLVFVKRIPAPINFNQQKIGSNPLSSPSVKAALDEVHAAKYQVKVAESGYWPSLSVVGQYNWLGLNANRPGVALSSTMGSNYSVGLSLSIPLLPALNVVAAVRSANAGVMNAMGSYDHVVSNVAGRMQEARKNLLYSQKSLMLSKQAVYLAREEESMTLLKLKHGFGNKISLERSRIKTLQAVVELDKSELKNILSQWLYLRANNPERFSSQLLVTTSDANE